MHLQNPESVPLQSCVSEIISLVNIDHDTGEHVVYKTPSLPYAVGFQSLITIKVLPANP
ncbi:hypothetical protein KSU1_D0092 [Candidatus Jettenia caeni]|uniref:Uncharacterized protein n=1 Tax=Candidatus Jettenia caeni TaxID=247490 RepID=I3INV6_9BACT|nr:hypothetical protein [Candidatus Jettenia sp. AMX1]WKZ15860.1 MAG: hypothetical protein QY317_00870 [Candidatus Jettenia caeni]GAB63401.1 hypothetical protein KSU1_D0092 [Candidatus Jettenia caeni]